MDLNLQPQLYGVIQPQPATLTLAVSVPTNRAGCVNMFLANNESYSDKVRVLVKPEGMDINDNQYLLYDTPIIVGHTVIISNLFVNQGDQVIVWSELGATTFNLTGTSFVYT